MDNTQNPFVQPQKSQPQPTSASKGSVLLVDDEPMVINLYKDVLIDAGFEVDSASSGGEALEKLTQRSYDLVLLDIMMPEMGGIETLRLIKGDKAKYRDPVVVMLTNIAMTEQISDANYAGAAGYLVKLSLSNDQLAEKVNGFLHGWK